MKQLEYCTKEGESPVIKNISIFYLTPSREGHVKPLLKERGPPRKTKYY